MLRGSVRSTASLMIRTARKRTFSSRHTLATAHDSMSTASAACRWPKARFCSASATMRLTVSSRPTCSPALAVWASCSLSRFPNLVLLVDDFVGHQDVALLEAIVEAAGESGQTTHRGRWPVMSARVAFSAAARPTPDSTTTSRLPERPPSARRARPCVAITPASRSTMPPDSIGIAETSPAWQTGMGGGCGGGVSASGCGPAVPGRQPGPPAASVSRAWPINQFRSKYCSIEREPSPCGRNTAPHYDQRGRLEARGQRSKRRRLIAAIFFKER